MTKIVKMRLENFKAIEIQEMSFNGCSAIITGGNNKGKTSFLRGMMDRIRFDRPKIKVRQGATEGMGELVLDSGERFLWEFDDAGRDKLTFISQEGTKANVTMELGKKFLPKLFDIDRFIESTPKDQVAQLQKIVGLDFTDVDKRYDEAYKYRYKCNEEAERYRVKLSKLMKCDPVKAVDVELLNIKRRELKADQEKERARLNEVYKENKINNEKLRAAWESAKQGLRIEWEDRKKAVFKEVSDFNEHNTNVRLAHNACFDALSILIRNGYQGMEAQDFVTALGNKIKKDRMASEEYPNEPTYPSQPDFIEEMPDRATLDEIEKKIESIDSEILEATNTNVKAKEYAEYIAYIEEVKAAALAAEEADRALQKIADERKEMIASAKFPEGISISSDPLGVTVDGFPLDRAQLSTSKLYTAALRIASMNLGEVRTLYFDCSFLDRNSLAEVNEWAEANDLQLLIERADYNGGEIQYTIIEG